MNPTVPVDNSDNITEEPDNASGSEDHIESVSTDKKRKLLDSDSEKEITVVSGKKKRKLRKGNELKKLHKPPTVEELNRLRETENLFHSNLFRLQIDELLNEVKISNKHKVRINLWFEKFKDWVFKLETSDDKFSLADLEWTKQWKTRVPLTAFQTSMKGWYQFQKPCNICLLGSYPMNCSLRASKVDIAVVMPRDFFHKEDFMNGRYHLKRALYLCELASHLESKQDLAEKVQFQCVEGDNWKPCIEIIPFGKLSSKTVCVVHLVPESNTFKFNRFSPGKNNVRSKWLFGDECNLIDEICPTSFYNSSILADMVAIENTQFLSKITDQNLIDGVILLKIWAKQRKFDYGLGGFNGHLTLMLIAYLFQIKKLHSLMSSYQVVRTVWNYLAQSEWDTNGVTLCNKEVNDNQPQMNDFHDNFSMVFVDPSGFLNLCSGMSTWCYNRLKTEAKLAIKYLDTPEINSFQVLFMESAPFSRLCDHSIIFHKWESLEKISSTYAIKESQLDQCGLIYPLARDCILKVLERGLGKRVRAIIVDNPPTLFWKLDKKPPNYRHRNPFAIGFLLDPEYCFSVVDKASETECDEFRQFWGSKSELRRFKDGIITEAVVWEAKVWSEKRMIARQIVQYLLKSKFEMFDTDYRYVADEIEFVLPVDREEITSKVFKEFDKLSKELRNINDLPLDITSVQGLSSVFSHSDLFPPCLPSEPLRNAVADSAGNSRMLSVVGEKLQAPDWSGIAHIQIQLAVSNKWPRDIEAIKRVRAAFNIKIASALTQQYGRVTQPFQDHLLVLTEAAVFKISLAYLGEIPLLKESKTPDGVTQYKDTPESLQVEKQCVHRPKLRSALHGLQSQNSSFGTACSLTKRWLRSHLIDSSHISDEAVDLLVAAVYLKPEPFYCPPTQPQTAFLRLLHLISTRNWNIDCLVLNFNNDLSKEEIFEIEANFSNNRTTLPSVFIATPYDRNKSIWTKDGPSPIVLLRVIELAKKTKENLLTQLFSSQITPDYKIHFRPSFSVYDVLIDINPQFNPTRYQALDFMSSCDSPTKESKKCDKIPVVDFDPVLKYLKELRRTYGEWCLFFNDNYGGSVIGVLWKPATFVPREFKIAQTHGRKLDEKSGSLVVDMYTIIDDFFIVGDGLVKSIRIKKNDKFELFTGTI